MARSKESIAKIPNDEYYTPRFIFEALKLDFDLDATAPEGGVPWLPAKKYYTEADDALIQTWEGLVWLNPPFSKPAPFIEKFMAHGNGVALVQISKALWFEKVWQDAHLLCLPKIHLKFEHRIEGTKGIFMPCVLIGMGQQAVQALHYSRLGKCR
jgi:hypothetical protein